MAEREISRSFRDAIRIGVWWLVGVAIPVLVAAIFIAIVMMMHHMM